MAALKSIKAGTSQVSLLTSLFEPRGDINPQVEIKYMQEPVFFPPSCVLYLKRENILVHFKIWQIHRPNISLPRAIVELLILSVAKFICVTSPSLNKSKPAWPTCLL